jgi:uncharacterized phage infection (PIP) family protein YhgE
MSIEVKGLADTVRLAKEAMRKAADSAMQLEFSAGQLTKTLAQVSGLTGELDAANADLQAAVGQLSNGGPPLEHTSTSGGGFGSTADVSGMTVKGMTVPGSIKLVDSYNHPRG